MQALVNAGGKGSRMGKCGIEKPMQMVERFLNSIGVETIRTSGESFMDDLHDAFKVMDGDYVLTCPSDLPLLTTERSWTRSWSTSCPGRWTRPSRSWTRRPSSGRG